MIQLQTYQQVSDRISVADIGQVYSDVLQSYTIDGRMYSYEAKYDEWASIMDEQGEGTWCGRLEWGKRNRYTGYDERPAGFDGGAEKISFNLGDVIWWQPPEDTHGNVVLRSSLRRTIQSILEYGYISLHVYAPDGEEESVGMIEPEDNGHYHAECVRDMITALHVQWIENQFYAPDLQRWIASGTNLI